MKYLGNNIRYYFELVISVILITLLGFSLLLGVKLATGIQVEITGFMIFLIVILSFILGLSIWMVALGGE